MVEVEYFTVSPSIFGRKGEWIVHKGGKVGIKLVYNYFPKVFEVFWWYYKISLVYLNLFSVEI